MFSIKKKLNGTVHGVCNGKRNFMKTFHRCSDKQVSFDHKIMTAEEALSKYVKPGHRIFIHGGCSSPKHVMKHMQCLEKSHRKYELIGMNTTFYENQVAPHLGWRNSKLFHTNVFVLGKDERDAIHACNEHHCQDGDQVDYLPIFLSEVPQLFKSGKMPIDVSLIQVSKPDIHGFCSLGLSVDISAAAAFESRIVIAQVSEEYVLTSI